MCSIDVIQLFAFNSIKLKPNAGINALTAHSVYICCVLAFADASLESNL